MLRAAYDFQAPYENTLTFCENDLFFELKRNNKDQDWLHVISIKGAHGYVPANYLTTAQCTTSEEIQYVDQVLSKLAAKSHKNCDHQSIIENLGEIRRKLVAEKEALAMKQVYEMFAIVRRNTKCSFQDAQVATHEILKYVQLNVLPLSSAGVQSVLKVDNSQIPLEIRRHCQDSQELDSLVRVVMEVAADQETEVPEETWDEFLVLITNADPALCIAALERHDCALLNQLVHRLQAETSWRKRKPILAILFRSLLLSPRFPEVAITSVLPAELARDIEATSSLQEVNRDRLFLSIRVLTAVLCCEKEWLPYDQREALGHVFLDCLLGILEEKLDTAATSMNERDFPDIPSAVVHLVLALYRQFDACSSDNNPVLQCLAARSKCDTLVEKIILHYNREDDPLQEFLNGDESQINSVSNFILGLFSRSGTARLFYTADLEVLLDVVKRCLRDYGPGDQRRSNALQLYYAVRKVNNVTYKQADFVRCMKEICEESQRLGTSSPTMEKDKCLVLKIYHEFPDLLENA